MPAAQYVVLHDFHTRIDDETGEEKAFAAGSVYDGPDSRLESLLGGEHSGEDADGSRWRGPLVARKSADEAKAAVEQAKDTKPASTEGN